MKTTNHDSDSDIEHTPTKSSKNHILVEKDDDVQPVPVKSVTINKPITLYDVINTINANAANSTKSGSGSTDTKQNTIDDEICPLCEIPDTFVSDKSYITCANCGYVANQVLDMNPEWTQYSGENSKEVNGRCSNSSSNPFYQKSSQGTIMAGSSNRRLKKKQEWSSHAYKEKSVNNMCSEIYSCCSKYKIPKIIIDDANIYYRTISECVHNNQDTTVDRIKMKNGKPIITRGNKRRGLLAACTYRACKKNNCPKTIGEIAEIYKITDKSVTMGLKKFDDIIKNSKNNFMIDDYNKNSDTAADYVKTYCKKLKLSKNKTEVAIRICKNTAKLRLATDHNPESVAAGSILLMTQYLNYNIDKRDMLARIKTSDVTANKICKKMKPFQRALVDDGATDYLLANIDNIQKKI